MKSLRLNFALNTTRTALGFLIPLVTFPYVSRMLLPEGLGRVEFANSIMSYFVLFTALGIPVYGMREIARVRDDEELRSRTVWELTLVLGLTVIAGYAAYFALVGLVPRLAAERRLFLIIAPSLFLSNFSYDWFYQGIENQTYITVRYIAIKALQIAAIFLLVRQRDHFARYAAIAVTLNGIAAVFNIAHLRRFVGFVPLRNLSVRRHLKPAFVVFASIVATSVYMHLDVTMLGFFCGEETVGLYTAANRLVRVVITLVTALSVVLVPRLEHCIESGDMAAYRRYLNLSIHYILIFAVPCCLGIAALAPDIIAIFAGGRYASSVLTARILSPIVLVVGLAYFVGLQVLYTRRREWQYTVAVGVAAAVNAVCNAALIPRFAQNGAAAGTLVAELLGLVIQIVFAWRFLRETDLFSLNTLKYAVAGGVMFAAVLAMPSFDGNVALHCALCVLLAAAVYGAGLFVLRERLVVELARRVIKR